LPGGKFGCRNQLIPPAPFSWKKEKGERKKAAKVSITKKLGETLCRNFVQRCATVYSYWQLANS